MARIKYSSELSPKMNRDILYLEPDETRFIVSNLYRGYEYAIDAMQAMADRLGNDIKTGQVTGDYADTFRNYRKKLLKQISYTKNKRSALLKRFTEDTKEYTISVLGNDIQSMNEAVEKIKDVL